MTDLWRWSMRRAAPVGNDQPRAGQTHASQMAADEPLVDPTLAADDPGQAWRQILRWLVNESQQRVQCRVQASDDLNRPAEIVVTVLDEAFRPLESAQVQLTIHPPDGPPYQVLAAADFQNPGQYRYEHWSQTPGGYRVAARAAAADGSELGTVEAGWTSDPAAGEFARLAADHDRLAILASETGGELVRDDSLASFVASLPNRKMPVSQTWVYPIWHRPWVMCLAIVCLCAEWGLRRWKGLP